MVSRPLIVVALRLLAAQSGSTLGYRMVGVTTHTPSEIILS